MTKLLLVEDDEDLSALVRDNLRRAGFVVDLAQSCQQALTLIRQNDYDLAVLDILLPDGDGRGLLTQLRQHKQQLPILLLTALGEVEERVAGLNAGADDYLVKPFATNELVARLRALLRRPQLTHTQWLSLGKLRYAPELHEVRVDEQVLILPRRELILLAALLRRAGHVVLKEKLVDILYEAADEVTPNALEAQISRLRRHLLEASSGLTIQTVRGVGYRLCPELVS
jgi:DNA-binding response OmpR family regulator